MGRGSGTQNHCGNVTYRKLVYLNKELYATSSKFDKLKISKAIVAAVRKFGGHFMQADEKRGGLYYDIGDKRAWDKTSQALREGQAEVRARLAEEDPSGMSKIAEYERVISEQTFLAYACKVLETLYHPKSGEDSGIAPCGQLCSHAKRRQTLNQMGADPRAVHQAIQSQVQIQPQTIQSLRPQSLTPPSAMQSLAPSPLPPPQVDQAYAQQAQPYDAGMQSARANINLASPVSSMQQTITPPQPMHPTMQNYQGNLNSVQTLPSLEPLPFNHSLNVNGNGQFATQVSTPRENFVNGMATSAPPLGGNINSPPLGGNINSLEPLPYYAAGQLNTNSTPGGSIDTSYSHAGPLNANAMHGGSTDSSYSNTGPLNANAMNGGSIDTPYSNTGPLNTNGMLGGPIDTSYPNTLAPNEVSATNNKQNVQSSLEPLPYQKQNEVYDLGKIDPISNRGSNETYGSIFSIRKYCSESLCMTSHEGKALMQQLDLEVDTLIRRKSYGLVQIDTTQAFEDLVFDDDSLNLDDKEPDEIPPPAVKRESMASLTLKDLVGRRKKGNTESSSSSRSRISGNTQSSGLSVRDDISLMNMSILTLDERGESSGSVLEDSPTVKTPSLVKPILSSDSKSTRKPRQRVSFAGKNISLMSMDDNSFGRLVDSISDPHAEPKQESGRLQREGSNASIHSTDSQQSVSRKMGFPMRKSVAAKFAVMDDEADDQVSSLSIGGASPHSQRQSDFTAMAGEVETPDNVKHSLRTTDMSISNLSLPATSSMSLFSDTDLDLLK